jgi:hypothetical protein
MPSLDSWEVYLIKIHYVMTLVTDLLEVGVRVMVFNATFNNISVISWRSVLLVEEIRVPAENRRPVTSHWQTLSYNVACSSNSSVFQLGPFHRADCPPFFKWRPVPFSWRHALFQSLCLLWWQYLTWPFGSGELKRHRLWKRAWRHEKGTGRHLKKGGQSENTLCDDACHWLIGGQFSASYCWRNYIVPVNASYWEQRYFMQLQ